MPPRFVNRMSALGSVVLHLLPSWALVGVALAVRHPAGLALLLLANSLAMSGLCRALDVDGETRFLATLLTRGTTHLLLYTAHAGMVLLLLGAPLYLLLKAPSLGAVLLVSASAVAVLLGVWRCWPAFGLACVWDDAYPAGSSGSWLRTAVVRCVRFASHLTSRHDLYFSHGLPVALALACVSFGALALTGLGGVLPTELRIVAGTLYGTLVLPLAGGVIVNRTLAAMLAVAGSAARQPAPALPMAPDTAPGLPNGLTRAELAAALLRAARSGDVELALASLEHGADPNAVPAPSDRDQRSALVLAALLPEVRLLRALISKGASVDLAHGGLTALLAATRGSLAGRPDAVLTLVANGADPNLADATGNTPLHHAALAAEPTVSAMLLDAGATLDLPNREGLTPLGQAIGVGNLAAARFLLERGARPDAQGARAALFAAAAVAEDDPGGVRLLLRHKARVAATDVLGRTALHVAALQGHFAIARALVEAGAPVDQADLQGTTPLMEAARAGAARLIGLFAGRGAEPNRIDQAGRSALVIACQTRQANAEAVRALLSMGADPAIATADGRRALDYALAGGRWDIVAVLNPSHPLPANVAEVSGNTPLPGADSPEYLLDALRFGHATVAAAFAPKLSEWPREVLAGLYLELAHQADLRSARTWLLTHGLAAETYLANGRRLFDVLLDDLPDTLAACDELLAAGATAAGAGLPRRVLECARAFPTVRVPLIALAQRLLESGGDPFAANTQGETCLHLAVQLDTQVIVQWLLERGADARARDALGRSPLHIALHAATGEDPTSRVRCLIRYGADPDAPAANGETALGLALTRHERDLKRWLHWTGWRLPGRALRGADLPAAAIAGDAAAVERLLQLGLPVDAADAQGATALLRACGLGHARIAVALIEAGADLEAAAPSGATCLTAAVSMGHDTIVDLLIVHGADIRRTLPGGATVLALAAGLGHARIVHRLLIAGADPALADERGATSLHAAAAYAFLHAAEPAARELLVSLLDAGAAVDPRNVRGETPLQLLLGSRAELGSPCQPLALAALLPLLLERGTDIDAQDERGVTPLHACAMHGLLGPAQHLLARGADRTRRDCLGRTPGDLARLLGHGELAALLGVATPIPSLAQMLRQQAPSA